MTRTMYCDYEKLIRATLIAFLVVVLATAGATSGPFEDANALRTEQATIGSGFGSHFQMACPMRSIVS